MQTTIVPQLLGWICVTLLSLNSCIAFVQEEEAIPKSEESVREFTRGVVESYQIRCKDRLLELNRVPILGWTNPVRKSKHGSVFVWTNLGRPEVIACVYFDTKTGWRHEFKSITSSPDVQAKQDNELIWSTHEHGIQWEPIADSESVSSKPAGRLAQMRRIARTFSGSFDNAGVDEELRLLSQPLFRYESVEAGVIDGAIFCLAQGTNPEILLIIEAVDSATQPWKFALARMTGYSCKAQQDGKPIWKCDRNSFGGPGSTTYYNRIVGQVPGSPE